jgi:hypothetical protein
LKFEKIDFDKTGQSTDDQKTEEINDVAKESDEESIYLFETNFLNTTQEILLLKIYKQNN